MDLATMVMFLTIVVSVIALFIAAYYGGLIGAMIIITICILGFATIPYPAFIPMWLCILVIVIDVILIAYKLAKAFGLGGQGNGN